MNWARVKWNIRTIPIFLDTISAIVSNTNSSFDTSVEQFLDCTIEFDYYNQSNNIKTTLCTIERIF